MTTANDQDPAADLPIAEPLRPSNAPTWTPEPVTPVASTVASPTADAVTYASRVSGPGKLRAGVVAGAAVALAVGAVATSLAASPAPTTTTAPGATSQAVGGPGGPAGAMMAPGLALDPVLGGIDDTFDHARDEMGFGGITIASISGSDVTLKTDDGWTRTIAVTDSVKLTKGGQTIALSDLAVGDDVRIQQTRNADGTYTVTGLAVVVPSVRGTVSDVSSSGFKVTNRDGSVWTITVNGSTQYQFGAGTGSLADVTNGTIVGVQGDKTGDNALTALTVRVAPDRVSGTVKSTTSDTIVVTKADGTTVTVNVDGSTTYRVAGVSTAASLGDVTVGMTIGASGRIGSDGSIAADTVFAGTPGPHGPAGDFGFGGRSGHGGFGPGMGGWDDQDGGASATPSPTATP
jgi:hypothetical protein